MTRKVEARERCKDAALLALKVEEGAVNKGEQAASRSREGEGRVLSLEPPEGK